MAGRGHDQPGDRHLRRPEDRPDDGRASGARPGSTATRPAGRRRCGRPRCTSRRSRPRSARCRSRRCGRRTVRSWTAELKADGLADSYVYALHARLSQVMSDAVHDGHPGPQPVLAPHLARSRRSAALRRHDRAGVGAARRVPDAPAPGGPARRVRRAADRRGRAGCGSSDVDFMRGVVQPAVQWPGEPLKTETSRTPCRSRRSWRWSSRRRWPGGAGTRRHGRRRAAGVDRGRSSARSASARPKVDGLPEGFRFHDLRHYLASLLIGSGLDVKVVQARLRHAQRQDDARHLRPPVARQRRVRTGRRRCCAGRPWGLVGD